MITEQQLADIAVHMAMRLGQAEARIVAKHPKAAKDGELASMLDDLDDHITMLLSAGAEPQGPETGEPGFDHLCQCRGPGLGCLGCLHEARGRQS